MNARSILAHVARPYIAFRICLAFVLAGFAVTAQVEAPRQVAAGQFTVAGDDGPH